MRTLLLLFFLLIPVVVLAQSANTFRQVTFSNLGAPTDNNVRFCSDCQATAPCTGSGRGAYAYRVQTGASTFAWNCSDGGPGGGGGSGDVTSDTATASVGQAAIFSNTTGKQIGRFTSSGWVKATGGVLSTQASINAATDITGNLPTANLNAGANASAATFWRGDGQWATPAGSGDMSSNTTSSTDGQLFVANGTSGKALKLFTSSGILKSTSGVVSAVTAPSGAIVGTTDSQTLTNKVIDGSSNTITNVSLATGVTSNLPVSRLNSGTSASATTFWRGDGTWATPAGAGTVTSVGLSLPNIFSTSGTPVTSTGTLTGTLATQSANLVFAGPTTGSAAAPTFRSLVAADIPSLDAAKITSGTMATARLGSGSASSSTFLRGDSTWATPVAGAGGSTTQFQFNNAGAIAGTSNFLYTSATGQVTLNQAGNGNQTLYGKRVTDSTPTGNFLLFQNQAASEDLFKVDVSGNATIAGALSMATATGTDGILTISSTSAGGGLQLTSGSKPTCDSTKRGLLWFVAGGAGVSDTLEVCRKNSSDVYGWVSLF